MESGVAQQIQLSASRTRLPRIESCLTSETSSLERGLGEAAPLSPWATGWVPAIHEGVLNGTPGSWLLPGPDLGVAGR